MTRPLRILLRIITSHLSDNDWLSSDFLFTLAVGEGERFAFVREVVVTLAEDSIETNETSTSLLWAVDV